VHSLHEFDSRWDLLIAEKSIIAVKFYLPRCQPCTAIAPIFQKLSEEFASKIFCVEINAHEHPSLARQLGFTRFPSFAYIKNGQKVAGHTGASESQIRSHCLSLIS
jgi:thioredoxin 1